MSLPLHPFAVKAASKLLDRRACGPPFLDPAILPWTPLFKEGIFPPRMRKRDRG
jgi:hypothetical protein